MGKNNKARRAAKARQRRRASARSSPPPGEPRARWYDDHCSEPEPEPEPDPEPEHTDADLVDELLLAASGARGSGTRSVFGAFERLLRLPAPIVDRAAERHLLAQVARLWTIGWQPAELLRQARRGSSTAGGRLVGLAIATDHAGRRSTTLDHRWSDQVDSLDLGAVDGRSGWATRWVATETFRGIEAVTTIVEVLAHLLRLPPLETILPPPGSGSSAPSRSPRPSPGPGSDPVLQRVRALLAKAESTSFEAEATAFTAKAQELITRHAIDAALLDADGTAHDGPVTVRIPVDDPYVDAKSLLLHVVAEQGRCRAIFYPSLALSSVVGFATDVGSVEMLFTSLLVQAQTAMAAAARNAPPGTRTRSRSYRSAFLVAYAHRIGRRLAEINATVISDTEAERGVSFLPVLRARSAVVDDAVADRYGDLVSFSVRGGHDPAGWASGTVAADQARLTAADLAERAG